jgi:hypothetical protein
MTEKPKFDFQVDLQGLRIRLTRRASVAVAAIVVGGAIILRLLSLW